MPKKGSPNSRCINLWSNAFKFKVVKSNIMMKLIFLAGPNLYK